MSIPLRPAAAQKVNCCEATRETPLEGSLRSHVFGPHSMFRHAQEVNCRKAAREATLECVTAKHDSNSFAFGEKAIIRR